MSVAVCSIGCTRKRNSIFSWDNLFDLEGDYSIYLNWEHSNRVAEFEDLEFLAKFASKHTNSERLTVDTWCWSQLAGKEFWRKAPKYDQDQARLTGIVTARNMCIDYAILTGASHLLFIDADVIPPSDIIPKLLELARPLVGGLVPGRGCHSNLRYLFGVQVNGTTNSGINYTEVDYGTCGCMMITREVFSGLRFRHTLENGGMSEDPAYCKDVKTLFNTRMYLRTDVICQHMGELANDQIAGY